MIDEISGLLWVELRRIMVLSGRVAEGEEIKGQINRETLPERLKL